MHTVGLARVISGKVVQIAVERNTYQSKRLTEEEQRNRVGHGSLALLKETPPITSGSSIKLKFSYASPKWHPGTKPKTWSLYMYISGETSNIWTSENTWKFSKFLKETVLGWLTKQKTA